LSIDPEGVDTSAGSSTRSYGHLLMQLSEDDVRGLDVALNEATWLGLSVDLENGRAAATLAVLGLAESGPPPDDRRVQLLMQPLGRIAVSYRSGRWNDESAEVLPITVEDLEKITIERPTSVYGWGFINREAKEPIAGWRQPLSLDVVLDKDACAISLDLQHDTDKFLGVRLWFDRFRLFTPNRAEIDMAAFIAAGKRWWEGLYSGDPRTEGFGIYPLNRSEQ
jgi:hypothetical protein